MKQQPMHCISILIDAECWELLAAIAEENEVPMAKVAACILRDELHQQRDAARYEELQEAEFVQQCAMEKQVEEEMAF